MAGAADVIYTLTIEGTAFVRDPVTGVKSTKPYTVQVNMDREQVSEGALSQFKRHWAPDNMKHILAGYEGLYEFKITNCVASDGSIPRDLKLMNRFDLLRHINNQEYDIIEELYEDTDALRQAVMDYEADRAAYIAQQEKLMKLHGKSIRLRKRMAELNPPLTPKEAPATNIMVTLDPPAVDEPTEPVKQPAGKAAAKKLGI